MPRRRRDFGEGIYHVGSHGSDARHLFVSDEDRVDFLQRLAAACREFELALLAYVLLANHYHTLVWIPDERISRALQRLHTEYSRHHNRRHGRNAHLFRAHAFAREIRSDEDLLGGYRYLARNPVEAGLVADPIDWPWSSARTHAGLEPSATALDESHLRAALGDRAGWRSRYREFIASEDEKGPQQRASK